MNPVRGVAVDLVGCMEEARGAPGILRTLRRVREQQQDEEVDLSRSIEGLGASRSTTATKHNMLLMDSPVWHACPCRARCHGAV